MFVCLPETRAEFSLVLFVTGFSSCLLFCVVQGPPGSRGLGGTRGPKGQRVIHVFLIISKVLVQMWETDEIS